MGLLGQKEVPVRLTRLSPTIIKCTALKSKDISRWLYLKMRITDGASSPFRRIASASTKGKIAAD